MFAKYDSKGKIKRQRVVIDCQKIIDSGKEICRTEQNHLQEVNINAIVKRHGVDTIQKTALLASQEFQFDDVTGNDFQEAMLKTTKAKQTFDQLPSAIRKEFDNSPAKFLDFVHNSENEQKMIEMGLANPKSQPQTVKVEVTNESLATTVLEKSNSGEDVQAE